MFSLHPPIPAALGIAAATLALTAAALVPAHLTSASASVRTSRPSGPKPTVVIEAGAWADNSSFAGVVRRLQHEGYTVDVPPDPLQGLRYDSRTLAGFLGSIAGPIVLVGHSYGGMVITNAATRNANVMALVYVDAFIPARGDTLQGLTGAQPGSCLAVKDPTKVFSFAPIPRAPASDVDAYVKPSVFAACFANGLPAGKAAVLAATQRPLATATLGDVSGAPAWTAIPSWAVVGTQDHVIPPAEQLFMASRAHAHITEVDAPHLSMISNPGVVTQVIVNAAQTTG
jgi:pimeloyl-ACP methyl ester carboxylesterase